jgi:hypothetical protein
MSFSYDLSTPVGQVRLLTRDVDPTNLIMTDEEYTQMLAQFDNDVKIAAAQSILVWANNYALCAKIKKAGGYEENLTQIATILRQNAESMLEHMNTPYEVAAEQTFGDPRQPWDGWQERDYLWRQRRRNNL